MAFLQIAINWAATKPSSFGTKNADRQLRIINLGILADHEPAMHGNIPLEGTARSTRPPEGDDQIKEAEGPAQDILYPARLYASRYR